MIILVLLLGPVMTRATVLFRLLIIWNWLPTSRGKAGFHSVLPWFWLCSGQTPHWGCLFCPPEPLEQHGGWLPGAKRSLPCGACSVRKTKAGDPLQLEDVNHKEAFLKHNGFSFLSDTKAFFFFFFFQQSLGCSPTHVSSGRPASFAPLIPNLSRTAERKSSPTQLERLNMSRLVYDISSWGCACQWLFFCRLIEWRLIIFAEVCRKQGVCRWSECPFTSPTQTVGANKVMQACCNCSLCHILLHAWPRFTWWGIPKGQWARCNQSPEGCKKSLLLISSRTSSPEWICVWAELFKKKKKRVEVQLQGSL